jgi:hypothetical protein
MAHQKYDGIIEAVRYQPNGQIDVVRVYKKRGFVFSDILLMDRPALIDELSRGKKYVTGQRQIYVANVFVTGKSIHLSGKSKPIITTKEQAGSQDFLANVPVF